MAGNVKELSACPIFGFEWSRCHAEIEGQSYSDRNYWKLVSCVPFFNFYVGAVMIDWGVSLLFETVDGAKNKWGVDYQKTKATAMIARGVATLFFSGLLFLLVDTATSAGRAAFRKERVQEEEKSPNVITCTVGNTDVTSHISLDDVRTIYVGSDCRQSNPCQHHAIVILKDGRTARGLNSFDIYSIVSKISEEKINPTETRWNAEEVKKHFSHYSEARPDMGYPAKSAEEVLEKLYFESN